MVSSAASRRHRDIDPARIGSAEGYDQAADHYDAWAWQTFWRENEFPIVRSLLLEAIPKQAFATRGLLDVGVGTGAFLRYVAPDLPTGVRLVGVDVSRGMLRHASLRL